MARRHFIAAFAAILAFAAPALSAAGLPAVGMRQSSSGAAAADVKSIYDEGQASLEHGDLDRAETDFRKVLALDPNLAGAWGNLGVIAMRRKQWTHALELLRKAERLAPNVAGVRLNIGLVYFHEE
ncbi:MAG TPA: tetratricopeptide repeat protein, partial [Candidatus Acidoferrales bacterium]|nr:tetratricopeptide repeat protein [Candidatus Acidoferrales bacterium]